MMRPLLTHTLAALSIAVLAPHTLAAQSASSAQGLERLGPAARATVERLADSLAAHGLPAEAIYAKAAEGMLKGADDARIVAAVRTLARELGDARAALGASATPSELFAAATVLHMGVSPSDVKRLREARERLAHGATTPIATPLVVLGDLVTRGVASARALASVDALIARGAPDDDFTALRAAVARDIDAGRAPDAAALTRTQAVLQSIDARGRGRPRPE